MILVITAIGFYCFTGFLPSTAGGDHDPCLGLNHLTIADIWRSTSNIVTDGSYRCDEAIHLAWYRFSSLGNITTSPPDLHSCGTEYPLWMNDVLPSAGVTTTVTICMRTMSKTCLVQWSIQVKNCQSFYVYELESPPLCKSAYCFDALVLINLTTTSSSSTINTTSNPPSLKADISQTETKLDALLGVVIVIILVVAVHVSVMIVCHKMTTKNRIQADNRIDPGNAVPFEAGIKVIGLPI